MRSKDRFPVPIMPVPNQNWPVSWQESYTFDLLEVWKEHAKIDSSNIGYICAYSNRRKKTLELLMDSCPAPARVLDLAAAQGNFSIAMAGLGYQVTWNDLRSDLKHYVELKLPPELRIDYCAGNIFEMTREESELFDAVVALEVIEHVAHPDLFVKQLSELVKPGGVIILSTPNGAYFKNDLPRFSDCPDPSIFEGDQFKPNSDGHIFLLYRDELERFATEANLSVEKLEALTSPLTAGHIKTRQLLNSLSDKTIELFEKTARSLPRPVKDSILCQFVAVLRKNKFEQNKN